MFVPSFSYNIIMKLTKLSAYFFAVLLGASLCSFTSKTANDPIYNEPKKVAKTETVEEADNNLGTLNPDLTFQLRSMSITELGASFQIYAAFNETANLNNNYYVGYWGEGDSYLPASLSFYVRESSGNVVQRTAEINKIQSNTLYDGIGSVLGAQYLNGFCDIPLSYGEEVVYSEGVQIFNIFNYDYETRTADFENPTYSDCVISNLDSTTYPTKYNASNFFDLTYVGSSEFSGYSAFKFDVNNKGNEIYQSLTATTSRAYRNNEELIENGTIYVRSALSFGGSTHFLIHYSDGSSERINSTAENFEITNNEPVILLIEGVDVDSVVNIEIRDIYYNLDLYNRDTNSIITRTNFSQRFGNVYTHMVDLKNSTGDVVVNGVTDKYYINNDLLVGLLFGCSTFVFLAIVVPTYFYLKQKNRNDEFKRMNTKSYVTTATYGYLCIESLLLLVAFITIRATIFSNALVVFNPTDAYIVVFGVASIILVGYFIRYFTVMVKNNIEKRRRDRLNMNRDLIDDGTLIIR